MKKILKKALKDSKNTSRKFSQPILKDGRGKPSMETITIPQTLVEHYAKARGLNFEDAAIELVGKAIGRILGQDCPIHKKPPKGLEAEFEWVGVDLSDG